ncbi:DUF6545 domain-containing protein [Streptomyces sp. NPDC052000]|uniref:DUF6545 domain-containing protein n=1 Tax=Streptomyces sp. NPDC052000 TaxID=3155676 RepID=UPI00344F5B00
MHTLTDAVEQLRDYAPPGLFYAAEDAVEESAEDWPNPQAAAEALYIKTALLAVTRSQRTRCSSEPLPGKPLTTTEDEARWWAQVQHAYASIPPRQAEELLATVDPKSAEPRTAG